MNKRFLGLGFTFTAQDKGLEKKLTKIAELMERINKASGSGSVGSASGGATMRSAGAEARSSTEKSSFAKAKPDIDSDKINFLLNAMKEYSDALGPLGKSFKKNAEKTLEEGIKKGRTADQILGSFANQAERVAESMNLLGPKFDALKRVFVYIKSWVGEMSKSVENFLDTLGIRIRDLIPKEFIAALSIVKTMLSPIGKFFKNTFSSIFSSILSRTNESLKGGVQAKVSAITSRLSPGEEEIANKLKEVIDGIKKQGDQTNDSLLKMLVGSLGNVKSMPTIQKLLSLILDKSSGDGEKKSGGFFEKMKSLPLIGGLIAAGVAIWSFVKKAKAIEMIIKWFSKLSNVFRSSGLIESIVTFGARIRSMFGPFRLVSIATVGVIAAIIGITSAVWGFVTELWNQKDSIINWFSSVGEVFSAIGEYLMVKFSPIFKILDDYLITPITIVGQAIWGVVKLFSGVFKMFGTNIAKLVGEAFEVSSFFNRRAAEKIRESSEEIRKERGGIPSQSMRTSIDGQLIIGKKQIESTDQLSDRIAGLSDNIKNLLENGSWNKDVNIKLDVNSNAIKYKMEKESIMQQARSGY